MHINTYVLFISIILLSMIIQLGYFVACCREFGLYYIVQFSGFNLSLIFNTNYQAIIPQLLGYFPIFTYVSYLMLDNNAHSFIFDIG